MSQKQPLACDRPPLGGAGFGSNFIRHGLLGVVLSVMVFCAPDASAVSKINLSFDATEGQSQVAVPQPAYFSEHSVTLNLLFEGVADCPRISARLVQISLRLEAELLDRQAFECDGPPRGPDGEAVKATYSFQVPKVDKMSRFEWRFVRCATAVDPCDHLATFAFDAYPTNLLDPLKAWAAKHVLVARDPTGELQDFLEQIDIQFYERAVPAGPETEVLTLLLERGETSNRTDYGPHLAKGDLVVFRERIETLPVIRIRDIGNRHLTTVELVIVAKLNGDPAIQRVFLDILDLPGKKEPLR